MRFEQITSASLAKAIESVHRLDKTCADIEVLFHSEAFRNVALRIMQQCLEANASTAVMSDVLVTSSLHTGILIGLELAAHEALP